MHLNEQEVIPTTHTDAKSKIKMLWKVILP